jgi:hypothetical protein
MKTRPSFLPTQRSKLEKFYYAHGKTISLFPTLTNEAAIEVVDPQTIDLGYERIEYHRMTAAEYVSDRLG